MDEKLEEFRFQLGQATMSTKRALEILEEPKGPKRSTMYKFLLARALYILLGLYDQEDLRKVNE